VANRGEIAVRIIRACKEMGISTVAVYSQADSNALHVSLADESVCIGGNTVPESYLNMNAILSAAVCTGATAIHPGYGLLSENSRFAELCEKYGFTFIGPTAEVIRKMGDKEEAKKTMRDAGVPVIPGCGVPDSPDEAKAGADEIGYPLLCKARSGGGGRGIRLVRDKAEFERAYTAACEEAKNVTGDGGVYLEKFLTDTKHIEMQLLCDSAGNAVCLGERDCSMQRKSQKVVEESPSPFVDSGLRDKMTEVSLKAARAVGYRNAGTVEYLVDRDGNFYFMEMNTRLQVEHPVTEMVTGIDIVKWQIRIAAGVELPFKQEDIKIDGHAIECRINAENPYKDFRPSCGKITALHTPGGPWVRFDSAVYQNYAIPPYYDSMIGKLIVHAKTREEAIRKMKAALCELIIEGIENNSEFHTELLTRPEFLNGSYCTDFLPKLLTGKEESNV
jgi:acetyl-CoA carboxylase biotin carboxylase subunit